MAGQGLGSEHGLSTKVVMASREASGFRPGLGCARARVWKAKGPAASRSRRVCGVTRGARRRLLHTRQQGTRGNLGAALRWAHWRPVATPAAGKVGEVGRWCSPVGLVDDGLDAVSRRSRGGRGRAVQCGNGGVEVLALAW